jgi:hypothetical protein
MELKIYVIINSVLLLLLTLLLLLFIFAYTQKISLAFKSFFLPLFLLQTFFFLSLKQHWMLASMGGEWPSGHSPSGWEPGPGWSSVPGEETAFGLILRVERTYGPTATPAWHRGTPARRISKWNNLEKISYFLSEFIFIFVLIFFVPIHHLVMDKTVIRSSRE